MRYGVIADIHSNLEAFTAVIALLRARKVEAWLCCGDIVGYGPDPNECIRALRTLSPCAVVAGNHDRAACDMKDLGQFTEYAAKALLWTRGQLSEKNKIYLSELPKTLVSNDIMLAHGAPRDPLDEYLLTQLQYTENRPLLKTGVTFVGHTHMPVVFSRKDLHVLGKAREEVLLSSAEKYIINPGAVGQPRDGNPRASCAVYDSEEKIFTLYRVDYDFQATQTKMHRARLPAFLVERLAWGK